MQFIAKSKVLDVFINIYIDPQSDPAVRYVVNYLHFERMPGQTADKAPHACAPRLCLNASGAAFDVISYLHNYIDEETFVDEEPPGWRPTLEREMAVECALVEALPEIQSENGARGPRR